MNLSSPQIDVPENSKIQKNYQTLRFPYFLQANFPFIFISVLGSGAPAVGVCLCPAEKQQHRACSTEQSQTKAAVISCSA
jgi:hypothetical protein